MIVIFVALWMPTLFDPYIVYTRFMAVAGVVGICMAMDWLTKPSRD
jgi:hypothetical protein